MIGRSEAKECGWWKGEKETSAVETRNNPNKTRGRTKIMMRGPFCRLHETVEDERVEIAVGGRWSGYGDPFLGIYTAAMGASARPQTIPMKW